MKKIVFKKKYAAIISGVIIAGAVIYMFLNSPIDVRMETAERTDYSDTFTEKGVVKSETELHYFSEIEAGIQKVFVHKNDKVKAGDILVQLDLTNFQYERESHENALKKSRAEWEKRRYSADMVVSPKAYLDIARSERDAAASNLSYWETNVAGIRVLYAAGDVSLQGFQEAEAKLKEARSNYEAAELKYKDAASRINEAGENVNEEYYSADDRFYQAQIEEEESQIRMLDEKIERCSIRAEQDGIVTDLPAASITRVQQGDKLVTITGDSERRLEVNVLTNKEPYLKVGDKVSMTHRLKSDYNTYDGVITAIDSYAEKSVSALGADEYRVRVCVDVSGIEKLKEGYELDAQFTTYHSENAISVPNSALFTKDGQDCLFTVSGGRAHLKQVEVRHRGNIRSEISSGLSDGEIIIVDANQKELEDGAAVAEA